MTQSHRPRPLDGITVVSLEHAIAAPFCTRQLADLGARVIKIERPGVGDFARGYDERVNGLSSHFVWTNRSKQSLSLDLKQAEALPLLEKLLAGADVLVQNLAPGAAARLGLSYEALRERFPRLIVCDISGYGEGGPYEKKALRPADPERGRLPFGDWRRRAERDGQGRLFDRRYRRRHVRLLAASFRPQLLRASAPARAAASTCRCWRAWWSGWATRCTYAYQDAPPPPRAGASHSTIYPYGPFPAGDGGTVMLGLQNEREWRAFCDKVLRRPELADDERFSANFKRSANREAACADRRSLRRLAGRRGGGAPGTGADRQRPRQRHGRGLAHPQLQARQRWTSIDSSGRAPAGAVAAGQQQRLSFRAWMRCRRWAATATRCLPNWAVPRPISSACARPERYEEADMNPTDRAQRAVRPGDPPGADPQGPCQRRRPGHRRPRGCGGGGLKVEARANLRRFSSIRRKPGCWCGSTRRSIPGMPTTWR